MLRFYFLFVLLTVYIPLVAQTCVHTDLSTQFDFKINRSRYEIPDMMGDSSIVTLFVIDKKTNTPLQEISFYSLFYFSNVFFDCKNIRSYSTGRNQNNEVEDNDWGDIIIVDLNFDNKEDIAIKSNSGGNSGANYLFYMQDENGKFTLDTSLAAIMDFFPVKIDTRKKTLTTLAHSNVTSNCKTVYQYNPKSKRWKKIKQTLVPADY